MRQLTKEEISERIAKNVAALIDESARDTFVLNLGVGIPTLVSNYITNENVFVQAENGMVGVGAIAEGEDIHPQLINAGRQPVRETPGCAYFDSAASFGMIRGGHVDATVLGAFEVDQSASLSNWIIPGGKQLGVGGAMDLVAGAKRVILAMTHSSKGVPKLVKACALPVTGVGEADAVVTELGVFFFEEGEVVLKKRAPEVSVEEIRAATALTFSVDPALREMLP